MAAFVDKGDVGGSCRRLSTKGPDARLGPVWPDTLYENFNANVSRFRHVPIFVPRRAISLSKIPTERSQNPIKEPRAHMSTDPRVVLLARRVFQKKVQRNSPRGSVSRERRARERLGRARLLRFRVSFLRRDSGTFHVSFEKTFGQFKLGFTHSRSKIVQSQTPSQTISLNGTEVSSKVFKSRARLFHFFFFFFFFFSKVLKGPHASRTGDPSCFSLRVARLTRDQASCTSL